jgi:type VI secretion system protein ImpH
MAHSAWPTPDAVTSVRAPLSQLLGGANGERLRLGFYAALRRLECVYRDWPRLGEAPDPALDPVRLSQDPSLAFQASALTSVFDGNESHPPQVALGFFGVFGPFGPLPTHLTQYADERRRHRGDATLIGFLNIFHHRFASLFYRAWANAQPTVNLDRPESDRFARYLGALIGQGTTARPGATSDIDNLGLFTAVHFSARTRHPEGLAKVLQASFGVPVAIEQFIGQWMDIPPEYCWLIPSSVPDARSSLGVLGTSTRVGTQVWERQSKFRVTVGPLGAADYQRFLPDGEHLPRLVELVRRYAGPELDWDIRLVLAEPDRRAAIVGVVGLIGRTAYLGESDGGAKLFEDLVIDPLDHGASGAER